MFRNAVRATHPIVFAARPSFRPSASKIRNFSTTIRVLSGGPPPPQLYGEGAKPGTVPTDLEQATGLERLQLLGEMEGIKVFDDSPLDSSYLGTKSNPVLVPSYVSCQSGFRGPGLENQPTDYGFLGRGTHHWMHGFSC